MLPALIGVAIGLLLRFVIRYVQQQKRAKMAQGVLPKPQDWRPPKPGGGLADTTLKPGGKPVLRGVAGFYSGTVVEMTAESLTLGRDARASNMVLPGDANAVSQRHCIVSHDGARFQLEDCWSTNGTFLQNGEKLEPGQARPLSAGERFFLGDERNGFEVDYE